MRGAEKSLLLLCCKLGQAVKPLSSSEYLQLAQYVHTKIVTQHGALSQTISPLYLRSIGYSEQFCMRIGALLNREAALQAYLTQAKRIGVLTCASEGFPARLFSLGSDCPAVLFYRGDSRLLQTRCISLVGARKLLPRGFAFAQRIGTLAARSGFTLVSGGAIGADSTAQEACLAHGGNVICFVPDELQHYRERNRILYCSVDGYDAPFTAARALYRNHLIHAMGEKTFVAQCLETKGGSWSGSQANLRHGWSKLCVLNDGSTGANALIQMGAIAVDDALPNLGLQMPQKASF